MKIIVTATHIKRGIPRSETKCPIAHALHAVGFRGIEVRTRRIILRDRREVKLPARAKKFIATFDNYEPVKPFSFNI